MAEEKTLGSLSMRRALMSRTLMPPITMKFVAVELA